MAFRWRVIAVDAGEAQLNGTGNWEPFAAIEQDGRDLILCKGLLEDLADNASERGSDGGSEG
jgi:hypothetical protein